MNRREVVFALLALGSARAARAQQSGRIYRVGVLNAGRAPGSADAFYALSQEFEKLGWVEGKNLVIERRFAEDHIERLDALAAELVRLKVDVIYTVGTLAPLAAKRAMSTIPIVMGAAGDPLGSGLVSNLAHPGGNVTGNSMMVPELGGKRLELMKELLPSLTRAAIFWNAANPYSANVYRTTRDAANALSVALQSLELRKPEDFDAASQAALRERAGALLVVEDPLTFDLCAQIAKFAADHRLPAIYGLKFYVQAGGLMSYGASFADLQRRAVVYVDKILKGAKPGDLPVEQPRKFELIVSLKAARGIDLKIPASLLARADEMIE